MSHPNLCRVSRQALGPDFETRFSFAVLHRSSNRISGIKSVLRRDFRHKIYSSRVSRRDLNALRNRFSDTGIRNTFDDCFRAFSPFEKNEEFRGSSICGGRVQQASNLYCNWNFEKDFVEKLGPEIIRASGAERHAFKESDLSLIWPTIKITNATGGELGAIQIFRG